MRLLLTRIGDGMIRRAIRSSFGHWKFLTVAAGRPDFGSFCKRCKRKIAAKRAATRAAKRRRQKLEMREQNWDTDTTGGIPPFEFEMQTPIWALEEDLPSDPPITEKNASGSAVKAARHLTSALSPESWLQQVGTSPGGAVVDDDGLQAQLGAAIEERDRAKLENHALGEKLRQAQSQYEMRLKITGERHAEERRKLLADIERQRKRQRQLLEQVESSGSRWRSKLKASADEIMQLSGIIKELQTTNERLTSQKLQVEAVVVEMNRRWRSHDDSKQGVAGGKLDAQLQHVANVSASRPTLRPIKKRDGSDVRRKDCSKRCKEPLTTPVRSVI